MQPDTEVTSCLRNTLARPQRVTPSYPTQPISLSSSAGHHAISHAQARRNRSRFPDDFLFEVTAEEFANLKSHSATSSWGGRRKEHRLPRSRGPHDCGCAARALWPASYNSITRRQCARKAFKRSSGLRRCVASTSARSVWRLSIP